MKNKMLALIFDARFKNMCLVNIFVGCDNATIVVVVIWPKDVIAFTN
jgi:hypothetical protein